MPNYGRYSDPADQYQGTAFNPYTGRLNGAKLVMQFLSRMEADKRKKKEAGWELEDRQMAKELNKARVSDLTRPPTPPREPAQKGYVLPPSVRKKVALFHGFTDESEYDAYDPKFQEDLFNEYAESEKMARSRGLKVNLTKAGTTKLKMIDTALAQINKRASEVSAEYRALIMQPMSDQTGEAKELAKKTAENLNRLRMKFATYPWKMDENGNLPSSFEQELQSYLLAPDSVETGRVFETRKSYAPKTEQTKVIGGVTYYRWGDGKWRDSAEPTQTKR